MILNNFKKIHKNIGPSNRIGLYLMVFFIIIVTLLEMLSVGLVFPLLNQIVEPSDNSFSYFKAIFIDFDMSNSMNILTFLSLSILLLFLLKTIFLTLIIIFQIRFFIRLNKVITHKVFKKFLSQPFLFYLQRNTSTLLNTVTNESNHFVLYIESFINLLAETMLVLGLTVLLFYFEPVITSFAIVILFMISLAYLLFTNKLVSRLGKLRQQKVAMRIKNIQEGFGSIKEIILLSIKIFFLKKYDESTRDELDASGVFKLVSTLPRYYIELILIIGICIFLTYSSLNGLDIKQKLPFLGLAAVAAFKVMPSINRILSLIQNIRFTSPAVQIISKELELETVYDINEIGTKDIQSIKFDREIELNSISFKYPNSSEEALKNINIKIKKNEYIGIIGKSGSGKTTLINILLGLINPDKGVIRLDNYLNLDQQNLKVWQNKIGFVSQNVFLIDDTIKKNIALGLEENFIEKEKLEMAINMSQLREFIETLPLGVETKLGERGNRLSGGQLQRIGIARALYRNPEIIVLDEATNSLDIDTEASFMESIYNLKKNKTIIAISHRLSTVQKCDKIYVIAEGNIISSGTPDEILKK